MPTKSFASSMNTARKSACCTLSRIVGYSDLQKVHLTFFLKVDALVSIMAALQAEVGVHVRLILIKTHKNQEYTFDFGLVVFC